MSILNQVLKKFKPQSHWSSKIGDEMYEEPWLKNQKIKQKPEAFNQSIRLVFYLI